MDTFEVRLTVSVSDPSALWRKARDYLFASTSYTTDQVAETIGHPRSPNVPACLAVLLDRSDHLDGAEIEQHEVEELGDQ